MDIERRHTVANAVEGCLPIKRRLLQRLFGRADAQDESATVIILPVIRIERYDDPVAESAGHNSPPPEASTDRGAAGPKKDDDVIDAEYEVKE